MKVSIQTFYHITRILGIVFAYPLPHFYRLA